LSGSPDKNTDNLPKHIAVIMDGNGRWAKEKGLSRSKGHSEGAKALERLVKAAADFGIKYVTVYAFSSENWQRPNAEVSSLMNLLGKYLKECRKRAFEPDNNIRYRFIGDMTKLSEDLRNDIAELQDLTKEKNGICLCVALSYGGRGEIVSAVRKIADDVQEGKITLEKVNEDSFANYLYAPDIPYPDLLIRTGREKRISNFLLWQSAYTEMVFSDVLWPDFSEDDLRYALDEYGKRKRRFGNI